MAIFHLSVKCISRSHGRSATAAAAYRSATRIQDEHTGELHDYTKKGDVSFTELVLPDGAPDWAKEREQLWNRAEQAEKRRDSTVAREFEVALPDELSETHRRDLALELARNIVERHGCAADVAIHKPGRERDLRNHHAHILCTTRRLTPEGLTTKTRELDERKSGEVNRWREQWATLTNEYLKNAGLEARIDHRSLAEQGIERPPTKHFGPVVAERLRRGKDSTVAERIREEHLQDLAKRLVAATERGRLEREEKMLAQAIIDTETTLARALAARDARKERASWASSAAKPDRLPEMQRTHAQTLWLESRGQDPGREARPIETPKLELILDR